VHEFAPDGTYLGAWGTRGGAPGEFTEVSAVAIDVEGNFYIVDSQLNRVQVFGANQTYLYGFGETGPGDGQFRVIYSTALDGDGNIYVTDTDNHRVQKFQLPTLPMSAGTAVA
jgi:tripartite motif-containing protein 71